MTEYAWVHLTRLCGCNYKVMLCNQRKGKSIFVPDPQRPDKTYRIDAAKFDAGECQLRSSWCIEKWSDRAEQITASERNWQD